jgi:hypothetical protein
VVTVRPYERGHYYPALLSGGATIDDLLYQGADGRLTTIALGPQVGRAAQDGADGQLIDFIFDPLPDRGGWSGYEYTAGFADRGTGQAGVSEVGDNVDYTQAMVDDDMWYRFAFSSVQQLTNDVPYWTDPTPSPAAGVGLFGGDYLSPGVDSIFDFTFDETPGYSSAVSGGSLNYNAAAGSFDWTNVRPGDLARVRFDFNVVPQIANTTIETAMIWQTRLEDGTPTFTFALTGPTSFFGTGTIGRTILQRPEITAYFASYEDVNAKALLAIRSDNPVQIQPLATLAQIVR